MSKYYIKATRLPISVKMDKLLAWSTKIANGEDVDMCSLTYRQQILHSMIMLLNNNDLLMKLSKSCNNHQQCIQEQKINCNSC